MANIENTDHSNKQQFYGVSLPSDIERDGDIKLVFEDMKEAFEALRKYKGSRCKPFQTFNDANEFSQTVIISKEVESCDQNQNNKNIEKILSPFSGLHPRELSKLKRAIESGDCSVVQQLVRTNPRYLLGSGDTPSILMEGPRYNACHIAAKANKHEILRFILNTISDKQFWKLLFPFDVNDITENRIKFSLDLYLNTPCSEKALCDTPLHFGCKWGSMEAIAILLSYPQCDTEKTNKFDKRPIEVICERKGDNGLKKEILKLFEAQIYIPLIRDDFTAQICKPVQGRVEAIDFNGEVAAVAGPMSPKQAEKLYKTLKSPLKRTPNERNIRLSDPRKGLERICRNLCKDMEINWEEYWPFLKTRIDLTSEEALIQLERHLQHIYYDLDTKSSKEQNLLNSQSFDDQSRQLISQISKLSINSSDGISLFGSDNQIESFNEYSDCNQTLESNLDETSNDSFLSASSSPIFLYDFYINGANISREDMDAALALQHIIYSENCLQYDFIQYWFKRVREERPDIFDYRPPSDWSLCSIPVK